MAPRTARNKLRFLYLLVGTVGALGQPLASERRPPGAKLPPLQPPAREIKSRELLAERDGLKLKLYEKYRVGFEETWKESGKVILLIHGATWASRCTFDADPENGYSMMEMLADAGYDVFALDLHGYGKSEKSTEDDTDTVAAERDVNAAVEFIRSFRWVDRVHLFGYQWGAQPVSLYASFKPQKVGRVALLGMRWKQVEMRGAKFEGPVRVLGQQAALLKPEDGDLDPNFVRRRAQVCRAESQQAPNGALRDMTRPSPVDPQKLTVPVLFIQGEKDGSAAVQKDRMDLFQALGSTDKWFVFLPGLGKYAPIERNHARFDKVLLTFLEQH